MVVLRLMKTWKLHHVDNTSINKRQYCSSTTEQHVHSVAKLKTIIQFVLQTLADVL